MAPHGWMRFHRGTLSAYRWLKPPEPWMWSMLPWTVKKNPLSVCLSLLMLLLTATDRQSVRPGRCWGIGPSSPLTLPQPFIADPSTYPTIHLSVPPTGFNCLSLFTFTEHLPPPPSVLVATETADSGRVGGCLRALAAMPHAVLSQYISASVLLLWPWYADSSGGSVTILSTTQRLFVRLL